ncbi:hypothetical protein HNR31_003746, partial [Anoxybacillus caldiproteolyticus]|nr:hypothetical protein [Anoxybacillus caldiproteolyticus]
NVFFRSLYMISKTGGFFVYIYAFTMRFATRSIYFEILKVLTKLKFKSLYFKY